MAELWGALWSLVIKAVGLAMLWGAPHAIVALAGAFVAFLDVAYGISRPAPGVIVGYFGYVAIGRWHQTLKNRILLENYYLPGDLER